METDGSRFTGRLTSLKGKAIRLVHITRQALREIDEALEPVKSALPGLTEADDQLAGGRFVSFAVDLREHVLILHNALVEALDAFGQKGAADLAWLRDSLVETFNTMARGTAFAVESSKHLCEQPQ